MAFHEIYIRYIIVEALQSILLISDCVMSTIFFPIPPLIAPRQPYFSNISSHLFWLFLLLLLLHLTITLLLTIFLSVLTFTLIEGEKGVLHKDLNPHPIPQTKFSLDWLVFYMLYNKTKISRDLRQFRYATQPHLVCHLNLKIEILEL